MAVAERSLKRGKDEEKTAAASLAVLVCLQMGNSAAAEEAAAVLRPALALQMTANAADVGAAARAACALAYGVLSFVYSPETETPATMARLAAVFSSPKADAELQAECLEAWALLLTLVPSNQSVEAVQK